jgi:uncharacterized protein (TIGR03000 family)
MSARKWLLSLVSFLVVIAVVLASARSAAAWGCDWQIIIGAPPPGDPNYRDWGNLGIPGPPSGYPPTYGPYIHYPKPAPYILIRPEHPLAGPLLLAGTEAAVTPDATALIRVHVPADAELWFSGDKTAQQGEHRQFVTEPLTDGQVLRYEVRARWRQDGKVVEKTRQATVHSGDRLTVDFLGPAASGLPADLPPPRKVDTE